MICGIMGVCGRVAEWLKAHAWKACKGVTSSQVRILSLPPIRIFSDLLQGLF